MKLIQRAIALSSLLMMLTVSSVVGQSGQRTARVNIPFAFTVGQKSLPAGDYVLQQNKRDSDTVWVIKNSQGAVAVFLTSAVRSNDTQQETSVVFHKYESTYFLAEFWTAGTNSGRELHISDSERDSQKTSSVMREERVLIAQQR